MLAIVMGVIFVTLGLWGVFAWGWEFVVVIKGLIPAMFVCGGILAVIAGITSLRDTLEAKSSLKKEYENKEGNKEE